MKRSILIVILLTFMFSACSEKKPHHHSVSNDNSKEILVSQIDSLETIFKREGLQDRFTVSKLISAYTEFRNMYKDDKRAADYFLKAGNLSKSMNDWERAAKVYKNFFNDFQSHPKREEVLFLLGGIYDFWLNDKNKAKQTYEHYIKIYPKGEFIDDAKASLEFINVPLEERVKIFQKRNKKQN